MKGINWIWICVLLVAACQPEKPEILNYEDIAGESDRYPEGQDPNGAGEEKDSLAYLKTGLVKAGIFVEQVKPWEDALFPDRFGSLRSAKYSFASGKDTLRYATWVYADSLRVMNTVYNWIDCFGPKRKSAMVGESANLQRNPFTIWISDTSLIFIEANEAIDVTKWEDYLVGLGYEKDWNMVIEQGLGGRARWYTYEKEKKIPFKK